MTPAPSDTPHTSAAQASAAQAAAVAAAFRLPAAVAAVAPLGNGNVNDSFVVRCAAPAGAAPARFVLQRLNRSVFARPELVMANLLVLAEHVQGRLRRGCPLLQGRRWELPAVLPARDGERPWVERDGDFWRLISFVEAAHSVEVVADGPQGRELGFALGVFHQLISDLPAERLADTLEGFHVTPRYLAHYDALCPGAPPATRGAEGRAHGFIAARRALAPVLEQALAAGRLRLRPIHGDPKLNNVMFDERSGRAVALVDLDTVKPGLIHYDIGDCLRSCCNPLGEETSDLEAVQFDVDLCRQVLGGYLSAAAGFLSPADYDHLYDAIRLISFELGLRFFSDHLAGDVYFRTERPGHNLQRALVQFRLTESIEAREGDIRAVIAELRAQHAPSR